MKSSNGMISDVIIVGGGVIGCAIAYYLSKQNVRVTVIEKDEIGVGASSRNGGGIRQSARDLREMPLAIHGVRHMWPTLSEELGIDVEYHCDGNLRLGKTEGDKAVLQRIVDQGRESGLDIALIGRDDVKALCSYISEDVTVASYCATDGHGNPMKTTLAFYSAARRHGACFIQGDETESIIVRKSRAVGVRTRKGSYFAPTIIVAAGLGSRKICKTVGIDIPMKGILVEALVTEAQPQMFPQMIGTAASDFYGHQTDHGSFVFGGMTGLEPFASEEARRVNRPGTAPHICRAILGYFPGMAKMNIIRTWSGFLDEMADHVPVMDSVDEVPGLILACGFSGHGYGISPVVGKLISQLVTENKSELSLEAFRYNRF